MGLNDFTIGVAIVVFVFALVLVCMPENVRENFLNIFVTRRRRYWDGISSYEDEIMQFNSDVKRIEREDALKTAKMYLSPYDNIWNNLKLSNRFCELTLKNGTIRGKDLFQVGNNFRILKSKVYSIDALWNLLCHSFSNDITYSQLLKSCDNLNVSIKEIKSSSITKIGTERHKNTNPYIKVDINNCSEAELTALPCVNIIMAKRIVKKRDEICGFKTIEDFFLFLKLKPHSREILKDRIEINKMQVEKRILLNNERKIDF